MNEQKRERIDLYDKESNPLGRTIFRGERIPEGEYCLVVQIWLRNSQGNYLIQKRAETVRVWPGFWATTAGVVSTGETPLMGAVRELAEEMGITAVSTEFHQLFQYLRGRAINTAWLVEKEITLADVTLQPEEVSDVMWASANEIRQMVAAGTFYDYGDSLLACCAVHCTAPFAAQALPRTAQQASKRRSKQASGAASKQAAQQARKRRSSARNVRT
ncbi:MAG: NUDIX domain-containing protein, partial [Chloroflexota bacterium]